MGEEGGAGEGWWGGKGGIARHQTGRRVTKRTGLVFASCWNDKWHFKPPFHRNHHVISPSDLSSRSSTTICFTMLSKSISVAFVCTLFLAVLLLPPSFAARGMWGSRRKQTEDEDQESISAGLNSGFERRNTMAARGAGRMAAEVEVDTFGGRTPNNHRAATTTMGGGKDLAGMMGGNVADTVSNLLNMYLKMMEELVHSPDFETLVTPETMKTMFANLPGGMLDSNPEIAAMLDSPQFTDPVLLKQTVLQGVEAIKLYSGEIVQMFNDPDKLMQMMDQLPPQARTAIEGLMSGDMSGLKNMLAMIPGIDESQRAMLSNMLDGNMGDLKGIASQAAKKMLDNFDPSQTEAARQQFLANPAMAEMIGLTEDVLNDKAKFDELMSQGMDALMAAATGEDAVETGTADESETASSASSRLFKGARSA